MNKATKKKVAIGAGVGGGLLVLVLVLALVFRRKGSSSDAPKPTDGAEPALPLPGTAAGRNPGQGSVGGSGTVGELVGDLLGKLPDLKVTIPETGPDPYNPTDFPVQGQYYKVKEGDNLSTILAEAGFTGHLYPVKQALNHHPLNAWIPRQGGGQNETVRLLPRYEPLPGEDFAWKGDLLSATKSWTVYPALYIVKKSEV